MATNVWGVHARTSSRQSHAAAGRHCGRAARVRTRTVQHALAALRTPTPSPSTNPSAAATGWVPEKCWARLGGAGDLGSWLAERGPDSLHAFQGRQAAFPHLSPLSHHIAQSRTAAGARGQALAPADTRDRTPAARRRRASLRASPPPVARVQPSTLPLHHCADVTGLPCTRRRVLPHQGSSTQLAGQSQTSHAPLLPCRNGYLWPHAAAAAPAAAARASCLHAYWRWRRF